MFENITNKFITNIKKTAKDEINTAIDAQIPFVMGAIVLGVTILSLMSKDKVKTTEQTTITINNYYI